jgi:CRISPR-associated protein Cas2
MPYCVVAYDIPDDRRRLRLSRVLWGMLDRVQKSVLEGELEEHQVDRLEERIRRVVEAREDAIRIYPLCPACRRRIRRIGPSPLRADPGRLGNLRRPRIPLIPQNPGGFAEIYENKPKEAPIYRAGCPLIRQIWGAPGRGIGAGFRESPGGPIPGGDSRPRRWPGKHP